jgi:hypothetical protein
MLRRHFLRTLPLSAVAVRAAAGATPATFSAEGRKVRDLVVYHDRRFYCLSPSVITRADGELILVFRRAPDRRALGEKSTTHTDPNA